MITIWEICTSKENPRVPDCSSYRRKCVKFEITCSRQVHGVFLKSLEENIKFPKVSDVIFLVNNVFYLLYLLL